MIYYLSVIEIIHETNQKGEGLYPAAISKSSYIKNEYNSYYMLLFC